MVCSLCSSPIISLAPSETSYLVSLLNHAIGANALSHAHPEAQTTIWQTITQQNDEPLPAPASASPGSSTSVTNCDAERVFESTSATSIAWRLAHGMFQTNATLRSYLPWR